jgi:membrane associated rhomboid family serine protease
VATADEPMRCYRHPNRETYVSCSECGRGICPDCMVYAPVGIRCPDHARQAQGTARVAQSVRRASFEGTGSLVTKALIAVNVGVFLLQLSQGGTLNSPQGDIYARGALYGPLVAEGEWWRLFTSAFLHANLIHLGLNMLFLWWIGSPVEQAIGRWRYLLLYLVSGLSGSAGALLFTPNAVTVGASGALFGILGAAFVFEQQRNYVLGGGALTIIVLNLALTFTISNISIGGHLGGLAGGALAALALSRFGRAHAIYGRPGLLGIAGVLAIGLASVVVSFWAAGGA